jgi:hypothetical protein
VPIVPRNLGTLGGKFDPVASIPSFGFKESQVEYLNAVFDLLFRANFGLFLALHGKPLSPEVLRKIKPEVLEWQQCVFIYIPSVPGVKIKDLKRPHLIPCPWDKDTTDMLLDEWRQRLSPSPWANLPPYFQDMSPEGLYKDWNGPKLGR